MDFIYLCRLVQRMAADPNCAERNLLGITFEEFKDFCLFLNNLDDFQVSKILRTKKIIFIQIYIQKSVL